MRNMSASEGKGCAGTAARDVFVHAEGQVCYSQSVRPGCFAIANSKYPEL